MDGAVRESTSNSFLTRKGCDPNLEDLLRHMPEILDFDSTMVKYEVLNHLGALYEEEMALARGERIDAAAHRLAETSPVHQERDYFEDLLLSSTPPADYTYTSSYDSVSVCPPANIWLTNPFPLSPSPSLGSASPPTAVSPAYSMDDGSHCFSGFQDFQSDHNYATGGSLLPSLDQVSPNTNEAAELVMVNPRLVMPGFVDCPVRMPTPAPVAAPPATILSERDLNREQKTKVDVKRRLQKKCTQKLTQKREPRAATGVAARRGKTAAVAKELKSTQALLQPSTSSFKHSATALSSRAYSLYAEGVRPPQTGGKPAAYTRRLMDCHTESMKKKGSSAAGKKANNRHDEGKRSLHNELEKQRRIQLSSAFRRMQTVVPALMTMEKPSKSMVLGKTKEYFDRIALDTAANERELRLQTFQRDQKQNRVSQLMHKFRHLLTEEHLDNLSALEEEEEE